MSEIVEGEKCRALIILSLPGRRAVGANATQNSAAIFSSRELNFQATNMTRGFAVCHALALVSALRIRQSHQLQ
jgi:hypothetical protein